MAGIARPHTRFFGRIRSLTRVRALLGEHRLVTLTGVGGSGKTRLALRVVEEAVPALADEVCWVELAPVADEHLVEAAVCAGLELRPAAGASPRDAVIRRLESSRTLLVLDNCEHLVDACAELVAALLEHCPELRVLVTSREPVGLPEEATWPVPPLSIPDVDAADDRAVESAREAESVQLFVERARAMRPDFELTPANVAAVVRVCGRLEGIPLALELAAARVRVLGVEQIAERLERGLDLLSRSGRGAPARHRTMRAALDWSHELLPDPERVLFRQLAVFGGHASLEACEAVCADQAPGNPTTVDLLTGLVDQSLVVVDDPGGCARYRLLEPVRQFAMERLEQSGERDRIRSRHAAYYLRLARAAAPDLRGSDRPRSLERLEVGARQPQTRVGLFGRGGRRAGRGGAGRVAVLVLELRRPFRRGTDALGGGPRAVGLGSRRASDPPVDIGHAGVDAGRLRRGRAASRGERRGLSGRGA